MARSLPCVAVGSRLLYTRPGVVRHGVAERGESTRRLSCLDRASGEDATRHSPHTHTTQLPYTAPRKAKAIQYSTQITVQRVPVWAEGWAGCVG